MPQRLQCTLQGNRCRFLAPSTRLGAGRRTCGIALKTLSSNGNAARASSPETHAAVPSSAESQRANFSIGFGRDSAAGHAGNRIDAAVDVCAESSAGSQANGSELAANREACATPAAAADSGAGAGKDVQPAADADSATFVVPAVQPSDGANVRNRALAWPRFLISDRMRRLTAAPDDVPAEPSAQTRTQAVEEAPANAAPADSLVKVVAAHEAVLVQYSALVRPHMFTVACARLPSPPVPEDPEGLVVYAERLAELIGELLPEAVADGWGADHVEQAIDNALSQSLAASVVHAEGGCLDPSQARSPASPLHPAAGHCPALTRSSAERSSIVVTNSPFIMRCTLTRVYYQTCIIEYDVVRALLPRCCTMTASPQ